MESQSQSHQKNLKEITFDKKGLVVFLKILYGFFKEILKA